MRRFQQLGAGFWTAVATAALLLVAAVHPAAAAEAGGAPSEVVFLAQLVVLMLVGRLLGEAMQRIGQPSVMGMLLSGILLGPSVLGALWPDAQHALFPSGKDQKAMLDAVSQFGILLLLLLTGMETDLKLAQRVGRAAGDEADLELDVQQPAGPEHGGGVGVIGVGLARRAGDGGAADHHGARPAVIADGQVAPVGQQGLGVGGTSAHRSASFLGRTDRTRF